MPSFGESMKRERELRQISLREISESTKISLRYLDALERDDFRHLPGGVFNKGFVRAYSQYIGVDPESMVNAYLDEERRQRERLAARVEPVPRRANAGSVDPEPPPRDEARRRLRIAAALVLALAALAIVAIAAAVKLGYVGRWFSLRSPAAAIEGVEIAGANPGLSPDGGAPADAPIPGRREEPRR